MRLKRDGTRAETRFRLSPKRTSPFKSAGASGHSNTDSRVVRISVSNTGYTTFRGSVSVLATQSIRHFPSLPLPYVTVCHQVSNALYSVRHDTLRTLDLDQIPSDQTDQDSVCLHTP